MASQEYLDKMKVRQEYRNLWHTDLMSTIQRDPPCNSSFVSFFLSVFLCVFVFLKFDLSFINLNFADCCLAFWCGPCVSYMLRKRALYNDMSRYTCCAGYMPCSGRCGESKCPEFCLCTEVG
ncbi:hypothetical protein Gorai_010386, partial [Gossypium raimondii]|nr:hypothetical protein [Gossypium raimondii]